MKRASWPRYLGIIGAVLVPAAVIAAFNVPHAFQTGEVLKADSLNTNFNAVKAELESLQGRMAALETATADGAPPKDCVWIWNNPCPAGAGVDCIAQCPANKYAVAGGCHTVYPAAITESHPGPPTGAAFPPSGSSAKSWNQWACKASGDLRTAYALCCAI
jgi:hypothetical protein